MMKEEQGTKRETTTKKRNEKEPAMVTEGGQEQKNKPKITKRRQTRTNKRQNVNKERG